MIAPCPELDDVPWYSAGPGASVGATNRKAESDRRQGKGIQTRRSHDGCNRVHAKNDCSKIEAQTRNHLVMAGERLHLPNPAPVPMVVFAACQLRAALTSRSAYHLKFAVAFKIISSYLSQCLSPTVVPLIKL
jgi:hypothetical protein